MPRMLPGRMVDPTWAVVFFSAVIAALEVRRTLGERRRRKLRQVRRKIELVFAAGAWDWPTFRQGGRTLVLEASREFAELECLVHFPGDDRYDLNLKNVLNGLQGLLRGSEGVDRSKEIDEIRDRIGRELMGWVEDAWDLRKPSWSD